ncbi:MAG TPA: phospho-sugar mutase [bacterium]|nr:phospho-sugar mutase [bacterium]
MADRVEHYLRLLDVYRDMGEITEVTYRNAKAWLTQPEYAEYRERVCELIRPVPLIDAFYQLIPFGTGGRRGRVGVGSNRLNKRTIGESAQGVAAYIKKQDADGTLAERGVVIARDVRPSSAEFARLTAEVIAANGIKVYLFDGPRSTPLLSFAVRHLHTIAGVVITASHNPPSDNGFKAYWEDGGQMVAPHDKAVLEEVARVGAIERMDLEEAQRAGLVEMLDDRVDRAYLAMVRRDYDVCAERDARIVYSPLHGAGVTIVPPALEALGFADVHLPPAQVEMNGQFPTVRDNYPNPEIPAAMDLAVALGRQVNADVVMASDPDADRVGVFAPDGQGGFVYLTGNTVGAMMLEFLLGRLREQDRLPAKGYVLTTLVSTKLVRKICEAYGVEVVDDLLVGFKNMAAEILQREEKGLDPALMLFSFEESIGYMRSHEVRDKDSAAGACLLAQLAAWGKARGMSLVDFRERLYAKYGYFKESQFSVFLEGESGAEQMRYLMDRLRNHPPAQIAGYAVHAIVDRLTATRRVLATGAVEKTGLETSNVLVFELSADGLTNLAIRPSGTEPKIKHYIAHAGAAKEKATVDETVARLEAEIKRIEHEIIA